MTRLRVGDSEIEYSDQGFGEPVVLVHGSFFSDWFVPVAARAELADVRAVRVRRAGYVAGSAPPRHLSLADHASHLGTLLDTLNVERAHIVAHSSGALIALQLAAARPERVADLVLVEPARAADSWPADDVTRRFMTIYADFAVGDLHATFVHAMQTLCAPDYAQVITNALGPAALEQAERESAFQFADEGPAILEWCFDAAAASRIGQPVLLLQCVPMYGPIMADLVAWLPQATLTTLEGTDHMLPLRHPATLAALVAAFVRQHRILAPVDQVDSL